MQDVRIRMYKTLITLILTYGSDGCSLNLDMACFVRKILRRIFGAIKIDNISRERYNREYFNKNK